MEQKQCDLVRLLEKVMEGDESASRAFMEELYPTVIRIVRSHLPIRQSEEDLSQEIFVRIFTRLDRYQPRSGIPITHWVSRVAMTTCLDALRSERRRPELRWADMSEDQAFWLEYLASQEKETTPETETDTRELVELLLSQLTPSDRMILNMLYLQDKSVNEISELTGWSVPGVKVRAFRARNRLRKVAVKLQSKARYEEI